MTDSLRTIPHKQIIYGDKLGGGGVKRGQKLGRLRGENWAIHKFLNSINSLLQFPCKTPPLPHGGEVQIYP